MKKVLLTLALVTMSGRAFAQSSSDLYYTGSTSPTTGTTTTPTGTQFPMLMPLPTPTPLTATVPSAGTASINPSANQGQQSQNSGSGANAAIGAALIAAGMAMMANPPTQPAGAALVAMGALALAQSGEDSGDAGQSANTAATSANGVGASGTNGSTTTAQTNPAYGIGTTSYQSQLAAATQTLATAGYTITPTGLTQPDGSTVPNSAFNSAGGMASAGMSADTIKQVQSALADATGGISGPKVSSMAVAEGAGGAGGGETGGSKALPDFSFNLPGNKFKMTDAQKAALMAGKTINFDGDPIGVRGQNIFDMIHVAYQKKSDRHDFLDDGGGAAAGAAVRVPASVPVTKTYALPKAAPGYSNRNTR